MPRLSEGGFDAEDWGEIFDDAHRGSWGEREDEFIGQMEVKFERYGMDMFMSEKQEAWLLAIADRGRNKPR